MNTGDVRAGDVRANDRKMVRKNVVAAKNCALSILLLTVINWSLIFSLGISDYKLSVVLITFSTSAAFAAGYFAAYRAAGLEDE